MTPHGGPTSRVCRLVAPGALCWQDEPLGVPGADDVVCRTLRSAVSPGTEAAAYLGLPPLRPTPSPYPRYMGYMNVGEVIAAGARAAEGLPPGTVVFSHASHRDLVRLHRNRVVALVPAGVSPSQAAPSYLYRLALNALRRGAFGADRPVAVIGIGAIGLAAVQLAVLQGAVCVAVSDSAAARKAAAAVGGQALSRTAAADRAGQYRGRGGGLADLVVSTTSGWSDWQLALSMARFNGAIAVLGFPGRGQGMPQANPLASAFFYDRQLTVAAAGFGPPAAGIAEDAAAALSADMDRILAWIAGGQLDASALIGQTADAIRYPEICAGLAHDRAGPGTVVLDWSDFPAAEG